MPATRICGGDRIKLIWWSLRRGFGSVLFLTLVFSVATIAYGVELCDRQGTGELELAGLGVATFGALSYSSSEDRLELYGGVCLTSSLEIDGEPAWLLVAARLSAEGVSEVPYVTAQEVRLKMQDWIITAERFESDGTEFHLFDSKLERGDVVGEAERAVYDPQAGALELHRVTVGDPRYRVSGERAELIGDALVFSDAVATTCVCDGGELYVIAAPQLSLDMDGERVVLHGGVLKIGGTSIALAEEVELSEAALSDITFPIAIEYVAGDPATRRTGTGLGVIIPELQLDDGVALELGVTGLDVDHPLNGVVLLRLERRGVEATVGKAREGFQADVTVTEPLTPWLDFRFGVRNRPWLDADFLHEGFLGLKAARTWRDLLGGDLLELDGEALVAASSQTLNGAAVSGARLRAGAAATYRTPPTPAGRLTLATSAELSYYPVQDVWQHGVTFRPAWRGELGPVEFEAGWTRVITNSASPFSTRLDRLEPHSLLDARISLSGDLSPAVTAAVDVSAGYDLLANDKAGRLTKAGLRGELNYQGDGFSVQPRFHLELAGLLQSHGGAAGANDLPAFVSAGIDADVGEWELGLAGRYDLAAPAPGLKRFEVSAAFPIHVGEVSLRPFLAFDLVPTFNGGEPPLISGHGLEITWRNCCATVVVGYRQQDNRFTTSLGVRLNDER